MGHACGYSSSVYAVNVPQAEHAQQGAPAWALGRTDMAYDESLAQRIRDALVDHAGITEKKMFGGIAFLRQGLMFVGVSDKSLMARIGPVAYEEALRRQHVREM